VVLQHPVHCDVPVILDGVLAGTGGTTVFREKAGCGDVDARPARRFEPGVFLTWVLLPSGLPLDW